MRHRAVLAIALLLACSLAAMPSQAQRADWDSDRVTKLAIELNEAVIDLQRAMRREPPPHVASGQARARHRFLDTLRVLRTETRALASQLETGAGSEETRPIVRRAGVLIRDLRQEGRRMAWMQPVLGHAERAEKLISQIAPFYAES